MAQLIWSVTGERYYETGVDRGVLFVDNQPGVAWSGMISVSESSSGGEPKPYYIDGVKFLNLAAAEEFEATLSAFHSPSEFSACDGTASIQNGLFVTQQPRKPFSLSYRTRIGNDTEGVEHAYKIHLVYNALAMPGERTNVTIADSTTPTTYTWSISTLPPSITGYRPTAHFVIDSRTTPPNLLAEIEAILYGDDTAASRLPTAQELVDLFKSEGYVVRTNVVTAPDMGAGDRWGIGDATLTADADELLVTPLTTGTKFLYWGYGSVNKIAVAVPGEVWTASMDVTSNVSENKRLFVAVLDANGNQIDAPHVWLWVDANVKQRLTFTTPPLPANTAFVGLVVSIDATATTDTMRISKVLLEKTDSVNPYFDGNTPDADGYYYSWEGTPYASASVVKTWL